MPDIYANVAHIQVTESAANTLTYKKLETGISLFEKMAWIICRIEYFWSAAYGASADGLIMGLTTSDNPSTLTPDQVAVVDISRRHRSDFGTAANGYIFKYPIMKDFTSLPGKGLIVPPNPLYLAAEGISQTVAQVLDVRLYYTAIELKGDEFWELVQARRIISSS